MADAMRWFGAKSLYRTALKGEPRSPDEATREAAEMLRTFHPAPVVGAESLAGAPTLLEERLVLLSALDADEATEKAEADAAKYAAQVSRNIYSQAIETRTLQYLEIYSLCGEPEDGTEVFSRQFLIDSSHADEEIVERLCPDDELDPGLRDGFEPNLHKTAEELRSHDLDVPSTK